MLLYELTENYQRYLIDCNTWKSGNLNLNGIYKQVWNVIVILLWEVKGH